MAETDQEADVPSAGCLADRRERRRPGPALTFLGGVAGVSGVRYLVEGPSTTLLIGCGFCAGPEVAWQRNFSPGPAELHSADAVILPSADLAHSGFLPQLVAEGWHGPVYATPGTAALLPVALSDAARQFAEDAVAAEVGGWSVRRPVLPPFREDDVARVVSLVRAVEWGTPRRLEGAEFEFGHAGGRLGAAWVRVSIGGRSVVFSGPLGSAGHPLLGPPDPRPPTEAVVLAAPRPAGDSYVAGRFAGAIHRALKRGGGVVVPASAVGSTEVVLTMIHDLTEAGRIPRLPVVLDGPAGLAGVEVHRRAVAERWSELRQDIRVELPGLFAEHTNGGPPDRPSIVVAGPATADTGRVLGHLATVLPDARAGVVLLGPQGQGTRVAQLAQGARHLKIHGRYLPVRAEVTVLAGTGEFAGPAEVQAWAMAAPPPETGFLVEGEPDASRALAKTLHARAGWCAVVPDDGERVLW